MHNCVVGNAVGDKDGTPVGASVGDALGTGVGLSVGAALGKTIQKAKTLKNALEYSF